MSEIYSYEENMEDIAITPEEDLSPDELALDETLGPVEKLNQYIGSDLVLHRLFVIKEMRNSMEECGLSIQEIAECVTPKLNFLNFDVEPIIRENFAAELPSITEFFIKRLNPSSSDNSDNAILMEVIRRHALEAVANLLFDAKEQVRNLAQESFINIAQKVPNAFQEDIICTFIDSIMVKGDADRSIVIALDLIKDVVEYLDIEIVKLRIFPIMEMTFQSPNFLIRQKSIITLSSIASTVDSDCVVDKIIPMLKTLIFDSVWGVRKSLAEKLPDFSLHVTQKCRLEDLVPICHRLLSDNSRWVVATIHDTLGGFIASFGVEEIKRLESSDYNVNHAEEASDKIPESLIENYLHILSKFETDVRENEKLALHAYYFPGVVMALGPSKWTFIREFFHNMALDIQWKVRKPIAHALHQVAKCLGPVITANDLMPFLDQFLKDFDEVKIGALEHLSDILAIIEPEHREIYLTVMNELIQQSGHHWRIRYIIANQIVRLISLYKSSLTSQFLFPLSCTLARDQVAKVREKVKESFGLIYEKLLNFKEDSSLKEDFIEKVMEFKNENNFQRRIMFVEIVSVIAEHFCSNPQLDPNEINPFIEPLCSLAGDRVVNVRIAVARKLRHHIIVLDQLKSNPELRSAINLLMEDKSDDVAYFAGSSRPSHLARNDPSYNTTVDNPHPASEQNDNANMADSSPSKSTEELILQFHTENKSVSGVTELTQLHSNDPFVSPSVSMDFAYDNSSQLDEQHTDKKVVHDV